MTLPSRIGAFGLATALTTAGLSMLPSAPSQAAGIDPAPAGLSAAWLRTQLQDGVLRSAGDTDVEASMDAAAGFQATGDPATAAAITTALGPFVAAYVGTDPDDTHATQVARAAWFAQTRGVDTAPYAGLPARVAEQVLGAGRLTDDTPSTGPDADVVGQAYAAGALARAGDPKANLAVPYLAALQCGPGYLVATLPAPGAAPTCDSAQQPSVAATATAVIALDGVVAAQSLRDRAAAWLAGAQQDNGRWAADGRAGSGDAVTTGLAGSAMALVGRSGRAGQAAVWLRGQQLLNAGTCAGYAAADVGAVALDMGAFAAAVAPIAGRGDAVVSSFRRATAGALAVQAVSPGGPAVTDNQLTLPRFTKPGRAVTATVRSAPRNVLCATATTLTPTRLLTAYDSTADVTFTSGPDGPTTFTVVDPSGQVDSASVWSLPQKRLKLRLGSKKVRVGRVAVLKVEGLAPGERATATFRGKRKNTTTANAKGKARLRFVVTGKRGFVKVRISGEYRNRSRTKNLIVVR